MKNRKRTKLYGLCMGGMGLLIAVALFLPQIVFSMQDTYQMKNTEVKTRSSLNTSQLSAFYEEQTYARMKNLAGMNLDSAIVTAVEHEFETDAEMQELLENIFSQEWTMLPQMVVLSHYGIVLDKSLTMELSECKKYIVYQEDYQKGVALMLWYFDLYMTDSDVRIRLLADSETSHIYYMKITADESDADRKKDTVTDTAVKTAGGNKVVMYYDGSGAVSDSDSINMELLYKIADEFLMYLEYYGTYYEAYEEGLPKINEYGGFGTDAGYVDEYGGFSTDTGYVEADKELEDGEYHISFWLSYGEISLEFWFQAAYRNSDSFMPDMEIGIPAIAELIPEMMQN